MQNLVIIAIDNYFRQNGISINFVEV